MMPIDLDNLKEIPITREVIEHTLSNVPHDVILVGGQALSFWIFHYDIDPFVGQQNDIQFVSMDMDFLGRREHVEILAKALLGTAIYPPKHAMTILCGQVLLINKSDQNYMNIDVIHRIGNMDSAAIRQRSVESTINENSTFRVMHPLDVLVSRVENYRGITEKQTNNGLRQVELAIEVAYKYLIDIALNNEKAALRAIEKIAETARSPAGNFVRKYGVEIYNAIKPELIAKLIKNENFLSVRLPILQEEIIRAMKIPQAQTVLCSYCGQTCDGNCIGGMKL